MTVLAVRSGESSAVNVLGICDGFKMRWVDASLHPAKMVKVEPIRYGSNEEFIREAMCEYVAASS